MNRPEAEHRTSVTWFLIILVVVMISGSLRVIPVSAAPLTQTLPHDEIPPAAASGASCTALDLVLVIDQTSFANRNDPAGIRYEALKWVMNLMGMDRIFSCPDTVHRVALLDMANNVQYDLTPLNPAPLSSPTVYQAWVNEKYAEMEPSEASSRYFSDSVISAAKMLKDAPSLSGSRKQAIIVLAGDQGIPCTVNQPCSRGELSNNFYTNIINGIGRSLPPSENGPFVYMLAYQDYDPHLFQYQEFAKNFEWVTKKYNGEYILVEDSLDLIKKLTEVYLTLNPNPEIKRVAPGSLYIDPFLQDLTCYTFRQEKEFAVKYEPPDEYAENGGQLVSPLNPAEPGFQTIYVFKHPVPGEWELESGNDVLNYCQAVRVRDNERSNLVNLVDFPTSIPQFRGDVYPAYQPKNFVFQVPDNTGELLEEFDEYPDRIQATVTAEVTNKKYDLSFSYDRAAKQFVSNQPLPADSVGVHTWEIALYSPAGDPNDNTERLVLRDNGQYEVKKVMTFSAVLKKPDAQQKAVHGKPLSDTWLKLEPIEVEVQLVDEDGQPLDANKAFASGTDVDKVILVTLKQQGGSDEEIVALKQDDVDKSVFKGTAGTDKVTSAGNYLAAVSLQGILTEAYAWDKQAEPATFVRKDGPVTNPITYLVIALLLLAVAAFLMFLLVNAHLNPVKGWLSFYYPGSTREFDTLTLESKHRRKVVHYPAKVPETSPLLKHITRVEANMDKTGDAVNLSVFFDGDEADPSNPIVLYPDYTPEPSDRKAGQKKAGDLEHQEHRLKHGIYVRYHR